MRVNWGNFRLLFAKLRAVKGHGTQADVRCCFSLAQKIISTTWKAYRQPETTQAFQTRNSRSENSTKLFFIYKSLRVKRKLPEGHESNLDLTEVSSYRSFFTRSQLIRCSVGEETKRSTLNPKLDIFGNAIEIACYLYYNDNWNRFLVFVSFIDKIAATFLKTKDLLSVWLTLDSKKWFALRTCCNLTSFNSANYDPPRK